MSRVATPLGEETVNGEAVIQVTVKFNGDLFV